MFIPLYCHVLSTIMDDEPTIGTSDPIFLGVKLMFRTKCWTWFSWKNQKNKGVNWSNLQYMENPWKSIVCLGHDLLYWWILHFVSNWSTSPFHPFTGHRSSLDQEWVTEGNQQRSKEMCHAGCETKTKLCFARSRSCMSHRDGWRLTWVYDRSTVAQLDGSF